MSPSQKRIHALLLSANREFSTEEIARAVYGDRERPKNWRQAVMAEMSRFLRGQVRGAYLIERTSKRGAGNVGHYKIARDF